MTHHTGAVHDTPRKPDWRDNGACNGHNPERWFPKPGNNLAIQAAKTLCFGCPAIFHCAQHALTKGEDHGVWGGLSERQRNTIRKKYKVHQLQDLGTVKTAVSVALTDELNPTSTLRDLWDDNTQPMAGGHIAWRGTSTSFSFRGVPWTPKQLSFYLDRGHKAVGIIRRAPECPVIECVNPRHLMDNEERCLRKQLAA